MTYSKRSFASRIRWTVLVSVGATALCVWGVAYWGFGRLASDQRRETQERMLADRCDALLRATEWLKRDVELLARLESVEALTGVRSTGEEDATWKERLAAELDALVESRPGYFQARLISAADGGRELVRVDRREGQVVRVSEAELQRKGDRPYVRETLAAGPGEVYFSRVTLNREHGELELPHRPTLRVARCLAGTDGAAWGIVVINVDFGPLVEGLFAAELGRYRIFVADADGAFLHHPDPARTFGFDLGFDASLADEFPGLAPPGAAVGSTSTLDGSDELVHFRRIELTPGRELLVGVAASYADARARAAGVGLRAGAIALLLVLVAVGGTYAASSHLTRPLDEIASAAQRIADGARGVPLPTDSPNEAGHVARALESMLRELEHEETRLRATRDRLQRANLDLEHFAHAASHDLREPARRVSALTSLLELEEMDRVSETGCELIRRSREEAVRLQGVLTDLRALAGIGIGNLTREPVDLGAVVESILVEFEEETRLRDVRVRVDAAPTVDVYKELVVIVYRALVQNALDHARGDGFRLELTFARLQGRWVCGVKNTGSTIPPDQLVEVFEPFRRLSTFDGSGLGLSIVRRIVERHSGTIRVESGPDEVHVLFTLASMES